MKLDPAQVREWKREYEAANEFERQESRVHDRNCLKRAGDLAWFLLRQGLGPSEEEEHEFEIRLQRAKEAWLARSA